MKRISCLVLIFCMAAVLVLPSCTQTPSTDYADSTNWAVYGEGENMNADLFWVYPSVYFGDEENTNMPLDDEKGRSHAIGAYNQVRGLYEDVCRVYIPYYRQVGINSMTAEGVPENLSLIAYSDVKAAFKYYLDNVNDGRPIILAGFSQGADMCLRLLKEFFKDEELSSRLVAAYLIGWCVTQEDIDKCPWIKMAQGETDTGCVISYDCEAVEVTSSYLIPAGKKALSINPLNWKTDSTPADKSENIGACAVDYKGVLTSETAGLCGCYIDPTRGSLKVTDVATEDYPPALEVFGTGEFHTYDIAFFYRNIQKNISDRISVWLASKIAA